MKSETEIIAVREKLEKFRKQKNKEFGGTDYPKLRGWIDALTWVVGDKDHMYYIKKKFDPKVVKLLSEFQ